MKHIFIVNPKAGPIDRSEMLIEKIEQVSLSLNLEHFVFCTEYKGHATELVRTMCGFFPDESIRFYACGGLGTLCEVLNGITDLQKIEVAIYPIGTGNDIIRAFPIDDKHFLDFDRLIRGKPLQIDAIKINDLVAINHVCFSLDAKIGKDMNNPIFRSLGLINPSFSYIMPAIKNLILMLNLEPLKITMDNIVIEKYCTAAVVLNGCCYGRVFQPIKGTSVTDGIINMALSHNENKLILPKLFRSYQDGSIEKYPHVYSAYGTKSMIVKSGNHKEILFNYDGEVETAKVLNIEVMPKAVNFILPEVDEACSYTLG